MHEASTAVPSGSFRTTHPLGENLIAIASGKGGVGKTWFSVTLCFALARLHKKLVLLDADLGLANVDIQLGLTPDKDLGAVIDGRAPLRGAITHYETGGFDILAGRSGYGNLASLPVPQLLDLRGQFLALLPSYDLGLMDLAAGIDRAVLTLTSSAALSIVMLTDEPTSLSDAYAFIKVTRAGNPHANLQVVVNMAANKIEGEKEYDKLRLTAEKFLGFTPPLLGIVRRDPKVREAIRAQTPLLVRSPLCEAAQDVEAIAETLLRMPLAAQKKMPA